MEVKVVDNQTDETIIDLDVDIEATPLQSGIGGFGLILSQTTRMLSEFCGLRYCKREDDGEDLSPQDFLAHLAVHGAIALLEKVDTLLSIGHNAYDEGMADMSDLDRASLRAFVLSEVNRPVEPQGKLAEDPSEHHPEDGRFGHVDDEPVF